MRENWTRKMFTELFRTEKESSCCTQLISIIALQILNIEKDLNELWKLWKQHESDFDMKFIYFVMKRALCRIHMTLVGMS
jgi:hypothetical protein